MGFLLLELLKSFISLSLSLSPPPPSYSHHTVGPCNTSSPCQNGATCVNLGMGTAQYFCVCIGGFSGRDCTITPVLPPNSGPSNGRLCKVVAIVSIILCVCVCVRLCTMSTLINYYFMCMSLIFIASFDYETIFTTKISHLW